MENKKCPKCRTSLLDTIFYNVEVDYCPNCFGLWFEKEELRWTKDEKDKELIWLDIEIWHDRSKFKVSRGVRICPDCRLPLYEVYYGDSKIIVDICNICHGIWLDRGEFKKIIDWLKNQKNYIVINKYVKNVLEEASEIFTGPETFKEEILDFITILKLLRYKLLIRHPIISKIISDLPK